MLILVILFAGCWKVAAEDKEPEKAVLSSTEESEDGVREPGKSQGVNNEMFPAFAATVFCTAGIVIYVRRKETF